MDAWNTMNFPFGASLGLFAGAVAVSFRECTPTKKQVEKSGWGIFLHFFFKKILGASQLYSGEQT